jgi:hypothetical protein
MEETFRKIQAKLESADKKNVTGIQSIKRREMKEKEEYAEKPEAKTKEAAPKKSGGQQEFKKPSNTSGKNSKTRKHMEAIEEDNDEDEEVVRPRRSRGPRTPSQQSIAAQDEYVNQTPSIIGGSNQSKKTRFGSTDEHGNRLSNLPGEMRPSLPYDDNAETLIAKVENMSKSKNENISLRKKSKSKQPHLNQQNEADLDNQNTLKSLENFNQKLMQSKRVIDNGGKQFERKNYVRMNVNKKGSYKPAMRGAAFSNKLMANKKT